MSTNEDASVPLVRWLFVTNRVLTEYQVMVVTANDDGRLVNCRLDGSSIACLHMNVHWLFFDSCRQLLLAAPDVEPIGAYEADLLVVLGETVNGKLHAGPLEGDVLGRLKLKRQIPLAAGELQFSCRDLQLCAGPDVGFFPFFIHADNPLPARRTTGRFPAAGNLERCPMMCSFKPGPLRDQSN